MGDWKVFSKKRKINVLIRFLVILGWRGYFLRENVGEKIFVKIVGQIVF